MAESASIPLPDSEHPVTKRSRWRVLGWLAGILLLVLSIVPIGWLVIRWRTQREIDAELARIRAAGEPASFEEVIDSIPPLAAEKDCTQMYDEVFAIITSQRFQQEAGPFPYIGNGEVNVELIPPPGTDWPGLAAAAEFVDAQSHLFYTLDRAAELGGECRFPVTVSDLKTQDAWRVAIKSREAARLLILRGLVAAHRKDAEEVYRSLDSLGILPNCLTSEPQSIFLQLRANLYLVYTDQCAQLLDVVHFTDEQMESLQTIARDVDYSKQLHQAVLCDRLYCAQCFDGEYAQDSVLTELMAKRPWLWYFVSHVDAWEYWQTMRRYCDATKSSDVVQAWRNTLQVSDSLRGRFGETGTLQQRYYVSSRTIAQPYGNATAVIRALAAQRAFDAFVACYRYKLQHGDFPENLDALVPEYLPAIPTDPYSGAPIRYVHRDGEIVVYSIGDDGQDAGGMFQYLDGDVDDIGYRSNAWKRTYEAAQAKLQGSTSGAEEPSPSVEGFAAPAE